MNIFFILEYSEGQKTYKIIFNRDAERNIYIYIYILFWLFNAYFTCFNESAKNNFILAFLKKKILFLHILQKC
jgi:hypothetical protein